MKLEYAPMEPMLTQTEQPTPVLGWGKDGKLKQRWAITTYVNNQPTGLHGEWRDVPTIDTEECS